MIAEFPRSSKGLWLVPSRLAREQVEQRLAWLARSTSIATVWTWQDLWQEVRARKGDGPTALSDIATRAIRQEAIAKARVGGRLDVMSKVLDLPGYRKQIRDRIANWTRAGLGEHSVPDLATPIAVAEWLIFVNYRRILTQLHLEDRDGMAVWASNVLAADPPTHFQRMHNLYVVEPPITRDSVIALEAMSHRANVCQISLVLDDEPDRATLFTRQISFRQRFLDWDFIEDRVQEKPIRSIGIETIQRGLFRDDPPARSHQTEGVSFLESPEGDGEALLVARRVLDLLKEGVTPEEILLVPSTGGLLAQRVEETLKDWDVSVDSDRPIQYANDPSLAVLKLAATLPSNGWDAISLVDLLRNGRFQPSWEEASAPLVAATTATAIRESRAYHGEEQIRESLQRAASVQPKEGDQDARSRMRRSDRASIALPLFDRLRQTITRLSRSGPWSSCVERLFELAIEIGLHESPALDTLQNALEDHGAILQRLGRDREIWSWSSFAGEMNSIIRELTDRTIKNAVSGVKLYGLDNISGVSASHLILFGLAEGAFSSQAQSDEVSDNPVAREMKRFLTLVDLPSVGLTLSSPLANGKGEQLTPAAFLEDVQSLFSSQSIKHVTQVLPRVDGYLPAELANTPHEKRVRAVALACLDGDFEAVRFLSRQRGHRTALEGSARARRLAHWRLRRGQFGRFDGRLRDSRILEKLTREFSPDRRPFSASQLENLAECPFRYYLRYVLGLEPLEQRREFEEDHAGKGSMLHAGLEQLHKQIQDVPDPEGRQILERINADIEAVFDQILGRERQPASEVERGLHEIDSERLRKTAQRYTRQYQKYVENAGQVPRCAEFEVAFGDTKGEIPALTLGSGESAIRIQGKIDRIDIVDREGHEYFRVIDYKSGAVPEKADGTKGLALQLPLYVLATQRVIFANEPKAPLDAGYWGLKKEGFHPKHKMSGEKDKQSKLEAEWAEFAGRLEQYVLELVERSRLGDFPVSPRKNNCENHCDYRHVCRIKSARRAPKPWAESPSLGAGS